MFVGRDDELKQLRDVVNARQPNVAVVYGRRRVGKSSLITKAVTGKRALFFEGLENQSKKDQLANFLFQLSKQSRRKLDVGNVTTWREAFYLLYEAVKSKPACIVFDEFQWMANYRSEIVSHLKMTWDQYLSRIPGVTVILCGSLASFMTTKVVRSNAFYGRTNLVMHLQGFRLHETKRLLRQCGRDEILEAQMYLGGVPQYLDLVREQPSVRVAIDRLAFRENGYLVDEYDRIFTSHFGRNPSYRAIVTALSKKPYGLFRKELARAAKVDLGGGLTEHLFNLESAGFISSDTPFDKAPSSRLIKYHLSDAYLRFYFSFIRPNLKRIRSRSQKDLFAKISQTGRFHNWQGRAFEYVCLNHAGRIAEILGFQGIDFSVGPFFRSPSSTSAGVQVDLIFDRADNVLTLCEMKCSVSPIRSSVIKEVDRKVTVLKRLYPTKTIQKVLVIHGEAAKPLVASNYFYRIVQAVELMQ